MRKNAYDLDLLIFPNLIFYYFQVQSISVKQSQLFPGYFLLVLFYFYFFTSSVAF